MSNAPVTQYLSVVCSRLAANVCDVYCKCVLPNWFAKTLLVIAFVASILLYISLNGSDSLACKHWPVTLKVVVKVFKIATKTGNVNFLPSK